VRSGHTSCTTISGIFFGRVEKDRARPVPGRQGGSISISVKILAVMTACKTCLVYHIDKGLCVVPKEAADRITRILTREDRLDQEGELMRSELASGQTSTGWSVEVGKQERIGGQSVFRTRSAGVWVSSYRSWMQRLSWPSLKQKVIVIFPPQHPPGGSWS